MDSVDQTQIFSSEEQNNSTSVTTKVPLDLGFLSLFMRLVSSSLSLDPISLEGNTAVAWEIYTLLTLGDHCSASVTSKA